MTGNRNGAEVFRDTDYGDTINGVTFSADGRLATTSDDNNVRLYDHAFRLVVPPKVIDGALRIAFSPAAPCSQSVAPMNRG